MARPARLERATSRSATWRSIQLSYGRERDRLAVGREGAGSDPPPQWGGGESGIRTHGALTGTRALQARTFDHSVISPATPSSGPGSAGSQPGQIRLAEREGFEPSVRVTAHSLSRRAPSATRSSLRGAVFRVPPPPPEGKCGRPPGGILCLPNSGSERRILAPHPPGLKGFERSTALNV